MPDDLQLNLTPPVAKDGETPNIPKSPAPDILYETFSLKPNRSNIETAVVKKTTDS